MGRRRRRVIKVVKKRLPTVFSCPSCGEEAVKVVVSRSSSNATVQCAACGLEEVVEASPSDQMVDVYCRFTDRFYTAKGPSALIQQYAQAEAVPETQTMEEGERAGEAEVAEASTDAASGTPEHKPLEQESSEEQTQEPEEAAREEA